MDDVGVSYSPDDYVWWITHRPKKVVRVCGQMTKSILFNVTFAACYWGKVLRRSRY